MNFKGLLSRNFSSSGLFGSLTTWTNLVTSPVKHVKRLLEPSGVDYQTMTNTTEEAFDEVGQEWQALITGNPFDVNTFQYLEAAIQNNFGTVDNPHVVFTSDAPFRYELTRFHGNLKSVLFLFQIRDMHRPAQRRRLRGTRKSFLYAPRRLPPEMPVLWPSFQACPTPKRVLC